MDTQLSELLSRIREEGIQKTEEKCVALLAEAEKEAESMRASAKQEADTIRASAEAERKSLRKNVESSLKNAARDLILEVERDLQDMFEGLILHSVKELQSVENVQDLLKSSLKEWLRAYGEVDIRLSEADAASLGKTFVAALGAEFAEKVRILSSQDVAKGFQVWKQDGTVYLDFSAISIAELLSRRLSPSLKEFLRTSR